MNVSDAFDTFHSRLIPSDAVLRNASEKVATVVRILENDAQLRPKKVLLSGSYAKHTHIAPLNDIDVVVHYPINDWVTARGQVFSPSIVIGRMFARLDQAYGHALTVRRQRRSVGLIYSDVKLDIVPALWELGPEYLSVIPDRISGSWVRTCIPKHLEFLSKRDKSYRPYAKTIRLVKAWRRNRSIRIPGFSLELLTIKALDTYGTSAQLHINFYNVMKLLSLNRLSSPIVFTDYHEASDFKTTSDPIHIFDPINPHNNVASAISTDGKQRLLEKFERDFRLVDLAIEAEDRGDNSTALRWWRAIFGDPFPYRPAPPKNGFWDSLFR